MADTNVRNRSIKRLTGTTLGAAALLACLGCAPSSAGTAEVATAAVGGTGASGTLVAAGESAAPQSGAGAPAIAPTITLPVPKNAPIRFGTSKRDIEAVRLANQATFGANDAVVTEIKAKGERQWLLDQFNAPRSIFSRQDAVEYHQAKSSVFCGDFVRSGMGTSEYCGVMYQLTTPVKIDFYKHATLGPDQLRQRVAFALSQIYVISAVELEGTYGFARYHQMLRDHAFGNFRDLLRAVTLNPMMGTYLNMVNNDKSDPNENYARELLQLFSIGTCRLNMDGTLAGGDCQPTYDNETVRAYAFALTGWTYPDGGINSLTCIGKYCRWANKTFFAGPMKPIAAEHDRMERRLLGGITVPASRSPEQALELVLDSIMAHPNTAPFISIRLIRALVTSNPTPGYVARVAAAFEGGRFGDIGSGRKGDLRAAIAAVLLDDEARSIEASLSPSFGKLREPVLQITALLRALGGYTDGDLVHPAHLGASLEQPLFHSPSVFNYYLLDYVVPGQGGVASPEFGITHANTVVARMYLGTAVLRDWYGRTGEGLAPGWIPGSIGTRVDLGSFDEVARNPVELVERLSVLLTAGRMTPPAKAAIVDAIRALPADQRARRAAYFISLSPDSQIQR